MGTDIHPVVQVRREGVWTSIPPFMGKWDEEDQWTAESGQAPPSLSYRNYDLFAILADVRNDRGFAGIETGTGWPSIAPERGLPEDLSLISLDTFQDSQIKIPGYHDPWETEGDPAEYWLGDHNYTWVMLAELEAFDWEHVGTKQYGVVDLTEYQKFKQTGEPPTHYCGALSGRDIVVESDPPSELATHVRISWGETAAEVVGEFYTVVLPWLRTLGKPEDVRIVMGFDN